MLLGRSVLRVPVWRRTWGLSKARRERRQRRPRWRGEQVGSELLGHTAAAAGVVAVLGLESFSRRGPCWDVCGQGMRGQESRRRWVVFLSLLCFLCPALDLPSIARPPVSSPSPSPLPVEVPLFAVTRWSPSPNNEPSPLPPPRRPPQSIPRFSDAFPALSPSRPLHDRPLRPPPLSQLGTTRPRSRAMLNSDFSRRVRTASSSTNQPQPVASTSAAPAGSEWPRLAPSSASSRTTIRVDSSAYVGAPSSTSSVFSAPPSPSKKRTYGDRCVEGRIPGQWEDGVGELTGALAQVHPDTGGNRPSHELPAPSGRPFDSHQGQAEGASTRDGRAERSVHAARFAQARPRTELDPLALLHRRSEQDL